MRSSAISVGRTRALKPTSGRSSIACLISDLNMSLATQKKACEVYAQKQGYEILGYFGGTYESAKTDERKEFNSMLDFRSQHESGYAEKSMRGVRSKTGL